MLGNVYTAEAYSITYMEHLHHNHHNNLPGVVPAMGDTPTSAIRKMGRIWN